MCSLQMLNQHDEDRQGENRYRNVLLILIFFFLGQNNFPDGWN